jgi:hypothetical protein
MNQTKTPVTANQLVAHNLRRARLLRGWTQEDAAKRLEPYLGKLWSKATFSAAERSAEPGTRAREFSADEILAFTRVFGMSLGWFFLPRVDRATIPPVSCGGSKLVDPSEVFDSALPYVRDDEEPQLRALMRRLELRGTLDQLISRSVAARPEVLAITASAGGEDVTTLASDLRRAAAALEAADDLAKSLFIDAYRKLDSKGKAHG